MLKQIYTFVFALLLSLTFSGILVAQSLAGNDKDSYQGPIPKEKILDGQNISTSYSSDLVLLFDNGPLVTHPGGGAGGADASALQTALTLTIYGFGAQITANNSVADDFTISGSDWAIDEIQFFTYQTGSTTTSATAGSSIFTGSGAGSGKVSAASDSSIFCMAFEPMPARPRTLFASVLIANIKLPTVSKPASVRMLKICSLMPA